MLQSNGYQIDYIESGSGPAVLFIPGSYSTNAAWRPMQNALPDIFKIISTNLCGYGDTSETRTLQNFGMDHELHIIKTIAEHVGEPLHLVGHSFGATVALAVALSGAVDVLSLSLFEPNPIDILQANGQTGLFNQTRERSDAFEAAYLSGDINAPRLIIDFWAGLGAFDGMPEGAQSYCRSHAFTNVLDWYTDYTFTASLADYEELDIPALLVRGSDSNPAMVAMTGALCDSICNNQAAVVEGASHSLIMTHAQECADILMNFLGNYPPEQH